jgi:hypothetical protein
MKRAILICGLFALAVYPCFSNAADQAPAPARLALKSKEMIIESPRPGVNIAGFATYTQCNGPEMVSWHGEESRSDVCDIMFRRFSSDNGKTWGPAESVATGRKVDGGMERRYLNPGFADPETGIFITMLIQAVMPNDDPNEGQSTWTVRYALSRDACRTNFVEAPVIHEGEGYDAAHPLPDIWIGKNGMFMGDKPSAMIRLKNGTYLQPVQLTMLDESGTLIRPWKSDYYASAVLIARWNADKSNLVWRMSEVVKPDSKRTTRGLFEGTIAEMPDGRILMIMRGSNAADPSFPARRWFSVSSDAGQTWTGAEPWTYSDGGEFHSPSSCSQIMRHSSGRYFWIGNLSPENCNGNSPRYPIVIVEVNATSFKPMRETLCILDNRQPDDPENLSLSNFYAIEDRASHDIVLYCPQWGRGMKTRALREKAGEITDMEKLYTGDLYTYRISVQ